MMLPTIFGENLFDDFMDESALIWKTVILPFRLLKALIKTKKITKAVISAVNVTAAA